MMKKPSVVTFECKSLEKMLKNYLSQSKNVRRHVGSIELIRCKQDEKYFCTTRGIKPQLIVIAEGSNSATRAMLGIKSFHVSDIRSQIAGSIEIEGGGIMVKH